MKLNIRIKKEIQHSIERDTYLNHFSEIDCSLGSSPYGHSSSVDTALQSVDYKMLTSYQDMYFDPNLLSQILKKWSQYGVSKTALFFGHGIYLLVERIMYKLLDISNGMLGYGPQFNEIPSEMQFAGGIYKGIPMTNNFEFPFEEMMEEIAINGIYAVIYIDNPNNPTGQIISLDKIEKIVSLAEKKGICVIIDEAYGDFMHDEQSAFKLVCKYSNLVVIRSFSKAYGLASMRASYCAVSDEIAPYFRKIDVPFEPTLLSAIAANAAIGDQVFLENVKKKVRAEKEIMIKGLRTLGFEVLPTDKNTSILCVYKKGMDVVKFFEECNVKVVSGVAFNKTNSMMDTSFARLRMPGSTLKCNEILNRMEEVLNSKLSFIK
ncbi:MAG: aminotransferase class I/II-fold pyridoxal phosphate-dependent enzyme [Saprospiraceae bacterium]|nr:aminotransferase class I/II-fold pyridoxal phosphate-dependent enzyme [Saprospiraceae bacterium]